MKFPRIDWLNHLIGFITTVIGIFIGLSLDERLKDNEMNERLAEFKLLLDEEVNINIDRLENFANLSRLHDEQLKFLINKKIDDNDVIVCRQAELDSVQLLWKSSPFIYEIEKNGDKQFHVKYSVKILETSPQTTIWESFKNTDLINHMKSEELADLSDRYSTFKTYERLIFENKAKLIDLVEDWNSRAVSRTERIQQVCDVMSKNTESIKSVVEGMRQTKN